MREILIFGVVIVVATYLFAGTRFTARWTRRQLGGALAISLIIYVILLLGQVAAWPISNLVVLSVSLLAASVIGTTLSSPAALITFCITAGLVDFFSFSGGFTAQIIANYEEGRNLLLQYLSISVPLPERITPIIGIGDLIILGGIYFALKQIGYHGRLAFLVPLAGLLLALTIGLLTGGIYALPFIGGTTVLYLLIAGKNSAK